MSNSEINAFMRGRQARAKAGGWQQQRRSRSLSKTPRGGGGAPNRTRSAPAGPRDRRCVNCGGRDHLADDCKQPRKEGTDRPCFDCGKTGHIARNCPNKGQRRAIKAVEREAAPPTRNVLAVCEVPGAAPVVRGRLIGNNAKTATVATPPLPPAPHSASRVRHPVDLAAYVATRVSQGERKRAAAAKRVGAQLLQLSGAIFAWKNIKMLVVLTVVVI